jgi:hypothetical protein
VIARESDTSAEAESENVGICGVGVLRATWTIPVVWSSGRDSRQGDNAFNAVTETSRLESREACLRLPILIWFSAYEAARVAPDPEWSYSEKAPIGRWLIETAWDETMAVKIKLDRPARVSTPDRDES